MDQNQELNQKIEDYLLGKLSAEDSKDMEDKMAADEELREAVQDQEAIHDSLYQSEYERLMSRASELRAETPDSKFENLQPSEAKISMETTKVDAKPSRSMLRTLAPLLAAAAFIGFLFLAAQFFFVSSSNGLASIVNKQTQSHHQAPLAQRSEDDIKNWGNFIQEYKEGDFKEAAAIGESIVASRQAKSEQLFYTGLAHLYGNPSSPQSAIKHLEQVASNESAFADDAKWYLALSLLKTDKPEKQRLKAAKRNLEQLLQSNYQKYPVSQLLSEVEKSLAD